MLQSKQRLFDVATIKSKDVAVTIKDSSSTATNITIYRDFNNHLKEQQPHGKTNRFNRRGTSNYSRDICSWDENLPASTKQAKLQTQESKGLRDNQAIHKYLKKLTLQATVCHARPYEKISELVKTKYQNNVAIVWPNSGLLVALYLLSPTQRYGTN